MTCPIAEALVLARRAQRVLTASDDGTARLWASAAGSSFTCLEHKGAVSTARFSVDGRRLITAGADRTARVWRAADGDPHLVLRHEGPVLSAVFSPDGRRIATVSENREDTRVTARVFDGRTGRLLYTPDQVGVASLFLQSGRQAVATALADRTARLWRATDGKPYPSSMSRMAMWSLPPSAGWTQLVTASDGGSAASGMSLLAVASSCCRPTNPAPVVVQSGWSVHPGFQPRPDGPRIYRADNGLQVAVLFCTRTA